MGEKKYPDQSDAAKANEQKGELVPAPPKLKGEVVQKKKSKFKEAFISEDIVDVTDYLFMDVFVPALKKLIEDVLTNGIRALFYGSTAKSNGRSNISYLTPYDKISSNNGSIKPYKRPVDVYNFKDVVFTEKSDAQDALDTLCEIGDRYGAASVADLYQIIRQNPTSIDFDWGWNDLRSARVVYNGRSGYMIDLPKVVSIKK